MHTKISISALLCIVLMGQLCASEDVLLEELISSSHIRTSSTSVNYVSCSKLFLSNDAVAEFPTKSQYILNAMYTWAEVDTGDGICVFMLAPMRRGLDDFEAERFVSAGSTDFPVENGESEFENDRDPILARPIDTEDHEHLLELQVEGESGSVDQATSDPRFQLIDPSAPFNSLALIQTGSSQTGGASAVQISPYVYVTAAHAIAQRGTGNLYPNLRVFPSYNLPNRTNGHIPIVAIPNPSYISAPNEFVGAQHDVGFIKMFTPRNLPRYPSIWRISGTDQPDAIVGDPFTDPWHILSLFSIYHGCIDSWRRLATYFNPSCIGGARSAGVTIFPIGYPAWVEGFDNRQALLPFFQYASLWGNPANYGLFHSGYMGSGSSVGLRAATSSGDSGGPIFGKISASTPAGFPPIPPLFSLLGIVTASVSGASIQPYTIGSYATRYWDQHIGWRPDFGLDVSGGNTHYANNDFGKVVKFRVKSPGIPVVDIYSRISGDSSSEQFLNFGSDEQSLSLRVRPGGAQRTYIISMFPRGSRAYTLASVRILVINSESPDPRNP